MAAKWVGLAHLGLAFDQSNNGHLDFNAFTLMGTDPSNSVAVTSFLGSASGGGFLKAATDALNGLEDPTPVFSRLPRATSRPKSPKSATRSTPKQNQVDQLQTTLINRWPRPTP